MGWIGAAVKVKMDRRKFLSRMVILLAGAASAAGLAAVERESGREQEAFPRTSRKKARYSRELAG